MSEGESGDGAGSGWWNGWIQSAKDKSSSVFSLVKRDLVEFTATMQEDGNKVAATVKEKFTQENANAASQKVKLGVSSFLGGISKALVIPPDDDYQLAQIVDGKAVMFDRYRARMHTIQTDPTTYTTDPEPDEKYREWLSTFDIESSKGAISELLVSNVEIRALYTQLVPLTVSNMDFWSRYYFRCYQLDEQEAKRVELMKRADISQREKDIGWDEDDDDDDWSTAPANRDQSEESTGCITAVTSDISPSTPSIISSAISTTSPTLSSDIDQMSADTTKLPSADQTSQHIPAISDSSANVISHNDSNATDSMLATRADPVSMVEVAPKSISMVTEQNSMVDAGTTENADRDSESSDNTKSDSLVVVTASSPERLSPSDENSSNAKESLDEDWEKDFDVEVTEQELQAAKERLKSASVVDSTQATDTDKVGEDWEDW